MKTSQVTQNKVKALITLLEDESNEISTTAMRELLTLDDKKLSSVVKDLQESSDLKLRKRVHQIQSIVKIRNNRKKLSGSLKNDDFLLQKGLTEIHLLWYDRDNEESLKKQIHDFLDEAKRDVLDTIFKIAAYMKKKNFTVSKNNEIESDSYCIGAVLDTKIGSDILLCALADLIGGIPKEVHSNSILKIICKHRKYLLVDGAGNCLDPVTWEVEKIDNLNSLKKLEAYNAGMIMRFIVYQLLLCAMCTASYRYVYTIGKCIGNTLSKEFPCGILEKPYSGKI